MINYVSVNYINFINLYLINFSDKKKALNNMSNSVAILLMVCMWKIDKSKAGASLQMELVSWSRFLRRVY